MKKLLAISISLILILSLTGCNKEELTNIQKYEKLIETSKNIESGKLEFDSVLDVDMITDDEQMAAQYAPIAGMLKNLKLSGSAEYKKTEKIGDFAMLYKVEMNGMTFDLEFYFDGDKMIINYPMMADYIVIDMNEMIGMLNDTEELDFELDFDMIMSNLDPIIEDITKISKEVMFENITEEDIEYLPKHIFTFNDVDITSEALKVNINIENMTDYMVSFLEKSKNVESFRSLVDLLDTEEDITMEVYNSYLDKGIEEMKLSGNELLEVYENINIEQYEVIFGYDKDYNVNNYDMVMIYDMYDEASEITFKLDIKMNAKMSEQNNIIEVTIPEITDKNSMSIMEMIGEMY